MTFRSKDDKSVYLGLAGYEPSNWQVLKHDLLTLAETGKAEFEKLDNYGLYFSVTGQLAGISKRLLWVKTIWMRDADEEITKFITLYPPK